MNLRLKTFGLALVALIAFSAMSAPGASATAKQFHAEQLATLTGEDSATNPPIFHIPGTGETKCDTAIYNATVSTTQTTVTATPTYSGCTTSGVHSIVEMNGCQYVFTLHTGTTSTGGATTHTHGPVHIVCPANQSITLRVTVFGFTVCLIHIGPQTPTSPTVDYKNLGSGATRHINLTSTITGVTAVTTDFGGCEGGVHHNAELTGQVTIKGYKHASSHTAVNQVGIWEQ